MSIFSNEKTESNTESQQSEEESDIEYIGSNYVVETILGEGSFGFVKKGYHVLTNEKIAIKTLEKERISEQSDIDRITREILILKKLRHPNIIQLLDIIETKTDLHLVLEYAEGGELYDYIVENTRLSEKESHLFYTQILYALEYIHSFNIAHRDIKPENILLTFNKSIKLIDFGLGNLYHQNEKLKTPCGSPCYAPPEMIEGKYYNPLKSDIWSSGIVLYTMLCGYLPFEDPDIRICYDKILNGKIDFPEWINDDLIDLFNNILCLNPEKRWSINEIRNHKWFKKYEFANNKIIFKFDDNIRDDILDLLEKEGFDKNEIKNDLIQNKINNLTANYHLMLKKTLQKNKISINVIKNKAKSYVDKIPGQNNLNKNLEKKRKTEISLKKKDSEKLRRNSTEEKKENNTIEIDERKKSKTITTKNLPKKKINNKRPTEIYKTFPSQNLAIVNESNSNNKINNSKQKSKSFAINKNDENLEPIILEYKKEIEKMTKNIELEKKNEIPEKQIENRENRENIKNRPKAKSILSEKKNSKTKKRVTYAFTANNQGIEKIENEIKLDKIPETNKKINDNINREKSKSFSSNVNNTSKDLNIKKRMTLNENKDNKNEKKTNKNLDNNDLEIKQTKILEINDEKIDKKESNTNNNKSKRGQSFSNNNSNDKKIDKKRFTTFDSLKKNYLEESSEQEKQEKTKKSVNNTIQNDIINSSIDNDNKESFDENSINSNLNNKNRVKSNSVDQIVVKGSLNTSDNKKRHTTYTKNSEFSGEKNIEKKSSYLLENNSTINEKETGISNEIEKNKQENNEIENNSSSDNQNNEIIDNNVINIKENSKNRGKSYSINNNFDSLKKKRNTNFTPEKRENFNEKNESNNINNNKIENNLLENSNDKKEQNINFVDDNEIKQKSNNGVRNKSASISYGMKDESFNSMKKKRNTNYSPDKIENKTSKNNEILKESLENESKTQVKEEIIDNNENIKNKKILNKNRGKSMSIGDELKRNENAKSNKNKRNTTYNQNQKLNEYKDEENENIINDSDIEKEEKQVLINKPLLNEEINEKEKKKINKRINDNDKNKIRGKSFSNNYDDSSKSNSNSKRYTTFSPDKKDINFINKSNNNNNSNIKNDSIKKEDSNNKSVDSENEKPEEDENYIDNEINNKKIQNKNKSKSISETKNTISNNNNKRYTTYNTTKNQENIEFITNFNENLSENDKKEIEIINEAANPLEIEDNKKNNIIVKNKSKSKSIVGDNKSIILLKNDKKRYTTFDKNINNNEININENEKILTKKEKTNNDNKKDLSENTKNNENNENNENNNEIELNNKKNNESSQKIKSKSKSIVAPSNTISEINQKKYSYGPEELKNKKKVVFTSEETKKSDVESNNNLKKSENNNDDSENENLENQKNKKVGFSGDYSDEPKPKMRKTGFKKPSKSDNIENEENIEDSFENNNDIVLNNDNKKKVGFDNDENNQENQNKKKIRKTIGNFKKPVELDEEENENQEKINKRASSGDNPNSFSQFSDNELYDEEEKVKKVGFSNENNDDNNNDKKTKIRKTVANFSKPKELDNDDEDLEEIVNENEIENNIQENDKKKNKVVFEEEIEEKTKNTKIRKTVANFSKPKELEENEEEYEENEISNKNKNKVGFEEELEEKPQKKKIRKTIANFKIPKELNEEDDEDNENNEQYPEEHDNKTNEDDDNREELIEKNQEFNNNEKLNDSGDKKNEIKNDKIRDFSQKRTTCANIINKNEDFENNKQRSKSINVNNIEKSNNSYPIFVNHENNTITEENKKEIFNNENEKKILKKNNKKNEYIYTKTSSLQELRVESKNNSSRFSLNYSFGSSEKDITKNSNLNTNRETDLMKFETPLKIENIPKITEKIIIEKEEVSRIKSKTITQKNDPKHDEIRRTTYDFNTESKYNKNILNSDLDKKSQTEIKNKNQEKLFSDKNLSEFNTDKKLNKQNKSIKHNKNLEKVYDILRKDRMMYISIKKSLDNPVKNEKEIQDLDKSIHDKPKINNLNQDSNKKNNNIKEKEEINVLESFYSVNPKELYLNLLSLISKLKIPFKNCDNTTVLLFIALDFEIKIQITSIDETNKYSQIKFYKIKGLDNRYIKFCSNLQYLLK